MTLNITDSSIRARQHLEQMVSDSNTGTCSHGCPCAPPRHTAPVLPVLKAGTQMSVEGLKRQGKWGLRQERGNESRSLGVQEGLFSFDLSL